MGFSNPYVARYSGPARAPRVGLFVPKANMEDFFSQIWHLIVTFANPFNLRHPEVYKAALEPPEVRWAGIVAVNLIVFTETGLLIGFLLPGDSLLVVTGLVARLAEWPILPLLISLCVAAIVGDTVGYWIGAKSGPAIFNRPSSRFFKREHLLAAKAYYDRRGGITIIIARFIPIIRTFVPIVAGAAKMEYRTFLFYNVFGGIGWITSMLMIGYLLDPLLKQLLGADFEIARHIDKVIIVVVGLSVLPLITKGFRHWRNGRKAAIAVLPTPTPTSGPTTPVV